MTTLFTERLLAWFEQAGRHDLPWQQQPTAYVIWVSEIMLQQTQVATVIPYYQQFMQQFPDLSALAAAPLERVLKYWAGLGYYARARHLHQAAIYLQQHQAGQFPQTLEAVMALPGIGRSTAGAILALAYHQPHPILDGNVKRVLSRYHAVAGWPGAPAVTARLWELAAQHTPQTATVAAYTQAIMDFGATLCTRKKPGCLHCPMRSDCQAYQTQTVANYPAAKPKAIRPVKKVQLLLLQDQQQRLYLEQRPTAGIWGGLWSLPECPEGTDPVFWCQQQWQWPIIVQQRLPELKHDFTHFQLRIMPVWAQLAVDTMMSPQGWFPVQHIIGHLALATPVRYLIQQWAQISYPALFK